jgi:NAD(P)-dependent dehydrogenase (short-subunit alcohol dehydrogenase family)
MDPTDARAVVTGAGSGIGRAIAGALLDRGGTVVFADIDRGRAEAAAGGRERAVPAVCDVAEPADVEGLAETAVEELGAVDLVAHCAGVGTGTPLIGGDVREARWVLDVNLAGSCHVAGVFGTLMAAQPEPSRILLVGSEHSLGYVHPGMAAYTASKHGVLGLAEVLRVELPEHVGVSVLCPGLVATDLWRGTEVRPDRYGGAAPGDELSREVLAEGMDVDEVARRTLAGVEADEFIVVTHAHVREYAEARWREVDGAFARQAPPEEADPAYHIAGILERKLGEFL